MHFKESFITDAGNKLLSEAISNSDSGTGVKSILWTKACTSSDQSITSKTRKEIQTLTDIQPYSSNGFVTNAIHSETSWDEGSSAESLNHHTTSLVCEITNKAYDGSVYSLGVWGKLVYADGAEGSETLIAVARISSTDTPDVIPSKNQSLYTANVTFVISVDDHVVNLLQAPDSFYATAQRLQTLENRAVTTHIEGSSTTGEAQDIYGNKTFKNAATVEEGFTVKAFTKLNEVRTNSITPASPSYYSLGTGKLKWKDIYTDDLYGTTHGNVIAEEGEILSLKAQSIGGTQQSGTSNLTVIGKLTGNADTATTATNLSNAPSLSFTNATSSSAGSTLTVTAGGQTSDAVTIETTRKTYQPYISITNGNAVYPLTFAPSVTKDASITAGFKTLYTDTLNNLYYNPSTNTLTCTTFSGSLSGNATTATTATNLANSPSLTFTNASSSSAGSTLTVTAGGKTSTAVTIETTRKAYQPYVNTSSNDLFYPVVFTDNTDTSADISSEFKNLYTNSKNYLYYNPYTDTLRCSKFNGTATYALNDKDGYALVSHDYVSWIKSATTKKTSISYLTYNNDSSSYSPTSGVYVPSGKLTIIDRDDTVMSESINIDPAVAGVIGDCSYSYSTTTYKYTVTYNIGCVTLVMFKTTGDGFSKVDANYTVGKYIINPKPVFLRTNGTDNDTILRMSGNYSAETAITLAGVWKLLTNIGKVASGNYAYALAVRIA